MLLKTLLLLRNKTGEIGLRTGQIDHLVNGVYTMYSFAALSKILVVGKYMVLRLCFPPQPGLDISASSIW